MFLPADETEANPAKKALQLGRKDVLPNQYEVITRDTLVGSVMILSESSEQLKFIHGKYDCWSHRLYS